MNSENQKVLQRGRWPLESPFGFGGAAISGEGGGYGFGEITERDALALLEKAYERGIKLFDTAPIYGFGLSEKRIGKAFKSNRENVFIVSKSGVSWHSSKRVNMTNDVKIAQKQLEQSLKDLKTDYIDLYMIHWPDDKVDIRESMEFLLKAKDKQMIKHIGLCNTNQSELDLALEVGSVDVIQSQFNVFEREGLESLRESLKKQEISFMSWGTLDKGILSGRVTPSRTFDASDCRSWAPWWKQVDHSFKYEFVKKITPLLDQMSLSLLDFSLGHNLFYEELDCFLCGAKNELQLENIQRSVDFILNQDGHKLFDKSFIEKSQGLVDECRRHHSDL